MTHPAIRRAVTLISQDNGGHLLGWFGLGPGPEEVVDRMIAAASVGRSTEELDAIDAFLSGLSAADLEALTTGEEAEAAAVGAPELVARFLTAAFEADVLAMGASPKGHGFARKGRGPDRSSLSVLTPDERREAVATARAISDIREARVRQVRAKGYTSAHDDQYVDGELERAAAAYALWDDEVARGAGMVEWLWPWKARFWKPRSHRENLVRAGALIVAAIEKIDRAEAQS